ncbi:hypothetical protein SAMN05421803_1262 [Nocardiopsis flavescens]|uniref:Uncharacterized protein n=1 Tax=Nocardiopsis flavescens TaxID=758803 RepID=A0A1M6U3M2_9ACTN|nr:hypothetical protein SAMN05421803_1262 [Nocardiopsis flavescens]
MPINVHRLCPGAQRQRTLHPLRRWEGMGVLYVRAAPRAPGPLQGAFLPPLGLGWDRLARPSPGTHPHHPGRAPNASHCKSAARRPRRGQVHAPLAAVSRWLSSWRTPVELSPPQPGVGATPSRWGQDRGPPTGRGQAPRFGEQPLRHRPPGQPRTPARHPERENNHHGTNPGPVPGHGAPPGGARTTTPRPSAPPRVPAGVRPPLSTWRLADAVFHVKPPHAKGAMFHVKHRPFSGLPASRGPGGPPRSGWAPRPPTRCAGPPPRPRRGRPCARTGSSAPGRTPRRCP